jgi:uncharacterized secreted protein with C-terminal beta-propeller domain
MGKLQMPKKYEMTIAGEKITIESKTHADVFRQFWAHFMNLDLQKTIDTIDLVNIRTSDQANFVAVNGQKKKNIPLTDNRWIYTHLTPAAMEKAYNKFIKGWNGEIAEPEKLKVASENEISDIAKQMIEKEKAKQTEQQPEPEEKKLTPKEERKLKTAAILEKQRAEKAEKKRKAEEKKKRKEDMKQLEKEVAELENQI